MLGLRSRSSALILQPPSYLRNNIWPISWTLSARLVEYHDIVSLSNGKHHGRTDNWDAAINPTPKIRYRSSERWIIWEETIILVQLQEGSELIRCRWEVVQLSNSSWVIVTACSLEKNASPGYRKIRDAWLEWKHGFLCLTRNDNIRNRPHQYFKFKLWELVQAQASSASGKKRKSQKLNKTGSSF